MENHITIYSNGIADFRRHYKVEKQQPLDISLPVRQDHLADVLGSFNVYGNVQLQNPPTFRPANAHDGNLHIGPGEPWSQLAQSLAGAQVRVDCTSGAVQGTLMGRQYLEEVQGEGTVKHPSLVLWTDAGLKTIRLRDVENVYFLQDEVRQEVDKALQRHFHSIKPDSTFVDLTLSTPDDLTDAHADALVQYTLPAAAWKISYRLNLADDHPTQLHGYAIVDNNTDEDWKDVRVSVVVGEPITFTTDLADSKSPHRQHVSLVRGEALGSVEVEEGVAYAAAMSMDFDDASAGPGIMMAAPAPAGGSMASAKMRKRLARSQMADKANAKVKSAQADESGDFCKFTSGDKVSIPAHRSTVIPMFQVAIDDAKTVLHYKVSNHATKPYRAVDFTNRTDFSLGRGMCTVYMENDYAGNCVMPGLKVGQQRLLPHALETGVTIKQDIKHLDRTLVSLKIADGMCVAQHRERRAIEYRLQNHRDQAFALWLDHARNIQHPELEAHLVKSRDDRQELSPTSDLDDGIRYQFQLDAQAQWSLRVVENRVTSQTLRILDAASSETLDGWESYLNHYMFKNGPLENHQGLGECQKLGLALEELQRLRHQNEERVKQLADRQQRMRDNIKAAGDDELARRWKRDLDESEQQLRELEDQVIPEQHQQEKQAVTDLRHAINNLAFQWENS